MENINEIRNSFEQNMIDSGYKVFKSSFKSALRGFQKKFIDDHGIKYFITIWHYNHFEQLERPDVPNRNTYTADTQFRFTKGTVESTCNIEYWGFIEPIKDSKIGLLTLKDIEIFFENAFNKLKPEYYEKW